MNRPMVFLSYAREDAKRARRLREALTKAGVNVWFDKDKLLGGERFWTTIQIAIRTSRWFIALLSSRAVSKRGVVQKEIREAIEVLDHYPDDEVYLIPVRLDDCTPSHERLKGLSWVDLFPNWRDGVDTLLRRFSPAVPSPTGERKPPPSLYAHGLYITRTRDSIYLYHYLRFYPDRTVVACSSSSTPAQLAPFMTTHNYHLAKGKWSIRGRTIRFSTLSEAGVVDYKGIVQPAGLIIMKHSHINGHRDVHEYRFRRLAVLDQRSKATQPSPSANRAHRLVRSPRDGVKNRQ